MPGRKRGAEAAQKCPGENGVRKQQRDVQSDRKQEALKHMNCVEAQKRMRSFLDGTLPDNELEEYTAHVESCSDCREELEIYYAFDQSFEDQSSELTGEFYNEKNAVESLLRSAARRGRRLRMWRRIRHSLLFLAVVSVVMVLLWLLGCFSFRGWESSLSRRRKQSAKTVWMQTEESESSKSIRMQTEESENAITVPAQTERK